MSNVSIERETFIEFDVDANAYIECVRWAEINMKFIVKY